MNHNPEPYTLKTKKTLIHKIAGPVLGLLLVLFLIQIFLPDKSGSKDNKEKVQVALKKLRSSDTLMQYQGLRDLEKFLTDAELLDEVAINILVLSDKRIFDAILRMCRQGNEFACALLNKYREVLRMNREREEKIPINVVVHEENASKKLLEFCKKNKITRMKELYEYVVSEIKINRDLLVEIQEILNEHGYPLKK